MAEQTKCKSLDEALLAVQMEIQNPLKNATNPHLRNSYADYNAVKDAVVPMFNKHGIVIKQRQVVIDGKSFINTILSHPSTKEFDDSCLTEIIFNSGNAQSQGSGISYARRYGLQTVAGTGSDDDDGNAASKPAKEPAKPSEGLPPQAPNNNPEKKRTPIQVKIAACKTEAALGKVWKELTPEQQDENKEYFTKMKEYINKPKYAKTNDKG